MSGSDCKEDDDQLRVYAVDSYLNVLKGNCFHLPQHFLQVMSWVCNLTNTLTQTLVKMLNMTQICLHVQVLGEYSHLQESVDQREVICLLTKLLDQKTITSVTRVWVLFALTKLSEDQTDLILDLLENLSSSQDTVLRQQAQELHHLSQDSQLHEWVLPRGAPWGSVEVFVYVNNCLDDVRVCRFLQSCDHENIQTILLSR